VDEEGRLLKRGKVELPGFRITVRPDMTLGGNGVLVGREEEGKQYPQGFINLDPTMKLDQLRPMVSFGIARPA
jgi:hypothetical protein